MHNHVDSKLFIPQLCSCIVDIKTDHAIAYSGIEGDILREEAEQDYFSRISIIGTPS